MIDKFLCSDCNYKWPILLKKGETIRKTLTQPAPYTYIFSKDFRRKRKEICPKCFSDRVIIDEGYNHD